MPTHKNIENIILNLIEDFKSYPDKYLTESDVKCALVSELMKIPEFNRLYATEDGSKSIPIHSEVRWYGQSGRLKWRSDIVIIDVGTLRVKNGIFKIPLPSNRSKELKRENKFTKLVWEIEDKMSKIASHK